MRLINSIPNLFTLLNLSFGIISIFYMFNEEYFIAAELIILAGFLDRFDGKLARKLNAISDLGKELDSLSDSISFGVAPALLVWKVILVNLGYLGGIVSIIYVICGIFRLAKYNITEFKGVYYGLPITIAGGLISLLVLYSLRYSINKYVILITILLLSYAMVSTKLKLKKM